MTRKVRISRRVRAALGGVLTAGILVGGAGVSRAEAADFNRTDLDFILTQIAIAENHAAGQPLFVPDNPATPVVESGLIPKDTLPYGLRTVTGVDNNIVPGNAHFGAADLLFPRLTNALFRDVTWDHDNNPGTPPIPTSYSQTTQAPVFDPAPRQTSNFIVDQTSGNPAATEAYNQNDRPGKAILPDNDPNTDLYFLPNKATDEGLSASYNSWFTLFGQFFDHGLDLVTKGGNGTVMVPLLPGDPLFNHPGPDGVRGDDPLTVDDPAVPGTQNDESADDPPNFMILSRARQFGNHEAQNTTTPFVDQNQTYTSHPSHQVFLREHERVADATSGNGQRTIATGRFLDDANGGLATWNDVKTQSQALLGIELVDRDIFDVPQLRTDAYGRLLTGDARGMAMYNTGTVAAPNWVEANGGPLPRDGSGNPQFVRIGHAFLDDIAHAANPTGDLDGRTSTSARGALSADPDAALGLTQAAVDLPQHYDDELLNRHFITGDGRGNENIGLTTVHLVFHAEHNRMAQQVKDLAFSSGDVEFLNKWLRTPVAAIPGSPATLEWNGERIFQAARFGTEMQYQHLVFEEFARKMQPEVDIFTGYHTEIDPAIVAEFAHSVYRFGHSMLNETLPRVNANGVTPNDLSLIDAFLNPVEFGADYGNNPAQAGGAVVRGTTRQVGNELDEFVTGALRNNLLGLPLDLATLNLARGRDTGIPSLNSARRQFAAATSHPALAPYESWNDFKVNIRHEESLVNFIAAYGRHSALDAQTTIAGKRDVAYAIVYGPDGADGVPGNDDPTVPVPSDRLEFLASTPGSAYASSASGVTVTGVDDIDLWIGGLAERQMPFGGLLGSTFNYVFETQMEKLQNGDRFYYLARTAGLNFLTQLEENSFAELIAKHTDATNLPADVFSRPDFLLDIGNSNPTSGPILNNPATPDNEATLLTRMNDGTIRFVGGEHVVLSGDGDSERMEVWDGDDTVWGNGGNDRITGGAGNDTLNGNAGNDIIKDNFGIDNIKGGSGNDAISVGAGTGDLTISGTDDDFVVQGADDKEVFLGEGDDVVDGSIGTDTTFGNEGDDWIEGGDNADLLQGGNGDPFQEDGASKPGAPTAPIVHSGHDVILGDGGNDDYDSEGGNDVMLTGPGIERNEGMLGFDWVTAQHDLEPAAYDMRFTGLMPPDVDALRDRFDLVEGLSGAARNDVLRGEDRSAPVPGVVDGNMFDNELRTEHLGLIAGLDNVLAGIPAPSATVRFDAGNIILGGGGNDLLEGRGGNDVIDGDRWLEVKLAVGAERFNNTGSAADGSPPGSPTLSERVLSGEINPGSINIVRTIRPSTTPASVDTAVFTGPRSEYTVTELADRVIVAHTTGSLVDGTDTLKNVEFLQFADQLVGVGGGPVNQSPTGQPSIGDTTPEEGQLLTAAVGTLVDPDGIAPGTLAFTWQMETAPNSGFFVSLLDADTFVPGSAQVGRRLRVVATFQDTLGVVQSVPSEPTAAVAKKSGPAAPVAPATAGTQNAQSTPPAIARLGQLALSRTVVPRTIASTVLTARGVQVSFTAPPGTRVVRVQVLKGGKSKKVLARVFVPTQAGKRKVTLRNGDIVRVLKRGGLFRLELTPGRSKTSLGKATVKLITIKKVTVKEKAGLPS